VAFKMCQNAFPAGALSQTCWGDHDAPPNPLVGWGGDSILPPTAPATKTRRLRCLGLEGGIAPEILLFRTACDGTPHLTNTLLLGVANMKPAPGSK